MFQWETIFKGNKKCGHCRQVVAKADLTVLFALYSLCNKLFFKIFFVFPQQWARDIGLKSDPIVRVPLHSVEHQYMITKPIPGLEPQKYPCEYQHPVKIIQFTVAVWAWEDKGQCRPNCEIHGDKILNTKYWICAHESCVIIIHLCTSSSLYDTQVEVILWKGETRLFMQHLHRCRSGYFKMYKVGLLHVLKICGYSGVIWDMC